MSNLITERSKKIAGLAIKTSNMDAANTIPTLWGKFYADNVAGDITGKVSDDVYAVYTDFENEGKNNEGEYTFLIGVEVDSNAEQDDQYVSTFIPESNYVKFEVPEKNAENVFPTWQGIWSNSELEKTFKCDFELYQQSGDISINVGTRLS